MAHLAIVIFDDGLDACRDCICNQFARLCRADKRDVDLGKSPAARDGAVCGGLSDDDPVQSGGRFERNCFVEWHNVEQRALAAGGRAL